MHALLPHFEEGALVAQLQEAVPLLQVVHPLEHVDQDARLDQKDVIAQVSNTLEPPIGPEDRPTEAESEGDHDFQLIV